MIARTNSDVAHPRTGRGNGTGHDNTGERNVDRSVADRGRQERIVYIAGAGGRLGNDGGDRAVCGVNERFSGACVQEWHRLYSLDARAVTRTRIADAGGTNSGGERQHRRDRTISGLCG